MVEKWTFNSWATALVKVLHAKCMLPQNSPSLLHRSCVIKLPILQWPFLGSPSHTFFWTFFWSCTKFLSSVHENGEQNQKCCVCIPVDTQAHSLI